MTYVLGVDLGTTFTAAAVREQGSEARMISLGSNSYAVPSVIFLREDGTLLAGEVAEMQSKSDPTRVARHFKRRLGDDVPIRLAGTSFSAQELAAELLALVLRTVSDRKGSPPSMVVLTHPANWGSYRTEVLAGAAEQAGMTNVRLMSEPEAAAVHYVESERLEVGEVIGVYDLGGGTFDAVVMRRTEEGFQNLGRPVGIERLGGVDFDESIRSFVIDSLDFSESPLDSFDDVDVDSEDALAAAHALQDSCVAAKRVLSADTVAHVRVAFPDLAQSVRLNRSEFEKRIRPRLLETLDAFESAVGSAGLSATDLSRILLVGGSSRIPVVSELLAQRFARPIAVDSDPKNTVALGAAVYGSSAGQVPASLETPASSEPPAVADPSLVSEAPVVPPVPERPPMAARLADPIPAPDDSVSMPPSEESEATPVEPLPVEADQRESEAGSEDGAADAVETPSIPSIPSSPTSPDAPAGGDGEPAIRQLHFGRSATPKPPVAPVPSVGPKGPNTTSVPAPASASQLSEAGSPAASPDTSRPSIVEPEITLPSTRSATDRDPSPSSANEPSGSASADTDELMGVKAESMHRARIPQVRSSVPAAETPVGAEDATPVGTDPKLIGVVVLLVVVVAVVAVVLVLSG